VPREYDPDPRLRVEALLAEWIEDDALTVATGLDFAPPRPESDAPPLLPLRQWLERSEEVHRFLRGREGRR
jgi:hypothetical protein